MNSKKLFDAVTRTAVARRTVLGVAGLAFAGGAVAGPAASAMAAPQAPVMHPVTAQAVVQQDKPGKPGMDKLVPHGTQGAQSRIDLDGEQRANV
ncbi:hypothetical protein AB0J86_12885, partial [Micromonospora sp. NPDC049559]